MKDRFVDSIEFKLIGDILASDGSLRQQILKIIENGGFVPTDFPTLEYQSIWRAIQSLVQQGRILTLDSIKAEMALRGTESRMGRKTSAALANVSVTGVTADELVENFQALRRSTYIANHQALMEELQERFKAADQSECLAISKEIEEANIAFQMAMASSGQMTPQQIQASSLGRNLLAIATMDPLLQCIEIRDMAQKYRIKQELLREMMEQVVYTSQPHESYDALELLGLSFPPVKYLIPDVLPECESLILAAAAGVGKSNLATAMILPLIEGGEFLGRPVEGGKKVLYISSDESLRALDRRFTDAGVKDAIAARVDQMGRDMFCIWTNHKASDRERLQRQLEQQQPDLVVIDSLSTVFGDTAKMTQNDAAFGRSLKTVIDDCNKAGAALVVIHHNSKREGASGLERMAGSHQIGARFWGVASLSRASKDASDPTRQFTMEKARELQEWSVKVKISPRDLWLSDGIYLPVIDEDESRALGSRDRLLETIKTSPMPICSAEAAERSEVPISSVYRLLGQLESAGLVWRDRQPFGKTWFYGVPGVHQKFDKTVQEAESVAQNEPVDPATAEAMATAAAIATATPEDRWDVVRELPEAELSAAIDHLPTDMVEEVMVLASDECEGWKVGDRGIYNTLDDTDAGRMFVEECKKDASFAAIYGKECTVKKWIYKRYTKAQKSAGARDSWNLAVIFDNAGEHSKQLVGLSCLNPLRSPQAVR